VSPVVPGDCWARAADDHRAIKIVTETEINRMGNSQKCSNAASGCSVFPQSQSKSSAAPSHLVTLPFRSMVRFRCCCHKLYS
jgi:hypothetical protein